MTTLRRMIELTIKKTDLAELASIARSRTEPAGRVERARILLAYRKDPSFYAVGQALGLHAQTVQRCIERAKAEGALAALDERPRPGKEPTTASRPPWMSVDEFATHISSSLPAGRSRVRPGRLIVSTSQLRPASADSIAVIIVSMTICVKCPMRVLATVYLFARSCDGGAWRHEQTDRPNRAGSRRSKGRGVKVTGGQIDKSGLLQIGESGF
jgi:hypothetical protein